MSGRADHALGARRVVQLGETKLSEASGQLTGASGAMRFDAELTLEPSGERGDFSDRLSVP